MTLEDLADRAAIHDVVLRYARGVDRHDWELVASCFTPEARSDYGFFQGAIDEVIPKIRDGVARYESTMHFMGNQLIEVDGEVAHCETYAIAYHRRQDGAEKKDRVVALRYLDDLVRREDRWLIDRRVVKVEWQRYDTVVLPPG